MKTQYEILTIKYTGNTQCYPIYDMPINLENIIKCYNWETFLTSDEYELYLKNSNAIHKFIQYIIDKGWKLINVTRTRIFSTGINEFIEYHFLKENNELKD